MAKKIFEYSYAFIRSDVGRRNGLPQLNASVPTHVVTLTQVGTSVHVGQTHLGTPFQVPVWVRKFSLGSTGDEISSLIIIQNLFVQQKFEY